MTFGVYTYHAGREFLSGTFARVKHPGRGKLAGRGRIVILRASMKVTVVEDLHGTESELKTQLHNEV